MNFTARTAQLACALFNHNEFKVVITAFKNPGRFSPPDEATLLRCSKRGFKTVFCAVLRYGDRLLLRAYNCKTRPLSTDTRGYMAVPLPGSTTEAVDPTEALCQIAEEATRQAWPK